MNVRHTLRAVIAPELNRIYTGPPYQKTPGGEVDCGWSCREHALHVRVLCALLGLSADVRLGEFDLKSPDVVETQSGTAGDGHAWCRVKSTLPVDLSMTFRFFAAGAGPQLYAPVFGLGRNGDYMLSYRLRDEAAPVEAADVHHITYTEHQILAFTPEELTNQPYLLIHSPDPNDHQNWDALFGQDLYAGITWHCFLLATGGGKSIPSKLSAGKAAKWIVSTYPNAVRDICAMLARREAK